MKSSISKIFVFMAAAFFAFSCSLQTLSKNVEFSTDLASKNDVIVSNPNVELMYARVVLTGGSGNEGISQCYGYIDIKNIAYTKKVTVHYSNGGGVWTTVGASYVGPSTSGYEKWYFVTPQYSFYAGGAASYQIAIQYEVSGQTYWDNNNSLDYKIDLGSRPVWYEATVGKNNVVLNKTSAYNHYDANYNLIGYNFSGNLKVKNLAYTKVVKVRYSTNNWSTYSEVNATYNSADPTDPDLEIWSFSQILPTSVNNVKFVVSYTVNGVTYWDNNEGRDYSHAVPGSIKVTLPR